MEVPTRDVSCCRVAAQTHRAVITLSCLVHCALFEDAQMRQRVDTGSRVAPLWMSRLRQRALVGNRLCSARHAAVVVDWTRRRGCELLEKREKAAHAKMWRHTQKTAIIRAAVRRQVEQRTRNQRSLLPARKGGRGKRRKYGEAGGMCCKGCPPGLSQERRPTPSVSQQQ